MDNFKNYTEIMVDEVLEDILKTEKNICTCEACILDIKAIALNNLPARYVVTEKGEVYKKLDSLNQQMRVDIYKALTKAINQVKKNPRHKPSV